MRTIDLDYEKFSTKEKLIDESLLKKRNQIAHGERIAINIQEYEQIEFEVRGLIENFQALIEDCVQKRSYANANM